MSRDNSRLHPKPPSTLISVNIGTKRTAMKDSKELLKAKTDAQADYSVRVVRSKIVPPLSVSPIKLITAMGARRTIKPMQDFGVLRCYIPVLGIIDKTPRSSSTIIMTNFTS